MSFHPIITKTKLFKKINKNLTILWSIIFIIRLIIELTIPDPIGILDIYL